MKRDYGNLTINDICKTHTMAFNEAMRRLVNKGYPFNRIKHLFDENDGDEFVVCGDDGYHIEKALTKEGRIEMTVRWGTFVASNLGKRWVDRTESGLYVPN